MKNKGIFVVVVVVLLFFFFDEPRVLGLLEGKSQIELTLNTSITCIAWHGP